MFYEYTVARKDRLIALKSNITFIRALARAQCVQHSTFQRTLDDECPSSLLSSSVIGNWETVVRAAPVSLCRPSWSLLIAKHNSLRSTSRFTFSLINQLATTIPTATTAAATRFKTTPKVFICVPKYCRWVSHVDDSVTSTVADDHCVGDALWLHFLCHHRTFGQEHDIGRYSSLSSGEQSSVVTLGCTFVHVRLYAVASLVRLWFDFAVCLYLRISSTLSTWTKKL